MQVSEIRDVSPGWQQLVPIQSLSQLLSFSAFWALLIGIAYLFTRNSTDPDVFALTGLGVTAGAFPALIVTLPQEFVAELDSERTAVSVLDEIDELLQFRGYRKKDGTSTADILYTSKLPAILSWKENSFSIRRVERSIVIRGPKGSVKWLRDRLTRTKIGS